METKRDNEIYFGFISLACGLLFSIFLYPLIEESVNYRRIFTIKEIQLIPISIWLYFLICLSFFIVSYGVFFKKEWTRKLSLIISIIFFLTTINTIIKGEPRFIGILIGGFFLVHAKGWSSDMYNIKSGKEFSKKSIRNYIILIIILGLPFLIAHILSYFSK